MNTYASISRGLIDNNIINITLRFLIDDNEHGSIIKEFHSIVINSNTIPDL